MKQQTRFRKFLVWFTIIGAIVLGAFSLACGVPEHGTVTSRNIQKNMPGGEGKDHTMINICVRAADGSTGCDNFPPSEVNNCQVNDKWPDCKEAIK